MRSLLVIMLLLAMALPVHADEDACDMLFVQDAKAMVFDGNRLTLKGANPNIGDGPHCMDSLRVELSSEPAY